MRLQSVTALTIVGVLLVMPPASSTNTPPRNVVGIWQEAAITAARSENTGAPMIARTLAIVSSCMYDAWAAYDARAIGTELRGALRRPPGERTEANKERAISYAAYRALAALLPAKTESVYKPMMRQLGYNPDDMSTDIESPTGIGNVVCLAVLEFRAHDKSNQLGNVLLSENTATPISYSAPYEDWSEYRSVNVPATVPARLPLTKTFDPDHWQPLIYFDSHGSLMIQKFLGAQWCYVTPFGMSEGDDFRFTLAPGPFKYGSQEYQQQAEELVTISAHLNDREKMISEYWQDGPNTVQPPGHWEQFALLVSARDHHSLDEDVKMFFVLNNALLDAGIAAWDAKRFYDSVRPVTAIEFLYKGRNIRAWGGPGKGTIEMDGARWIPYQPATSPTPPFPDFVSGHSTYSAAAARILELSTGSDRFGESVTLAAGSSKIEPGITPAEPVILRWSTFTDAANEAGMSRRYGGIHFALADLSGRRLGRLVADRAWAKAQSYFDGSCTSPVPMPPPG